MEITESEIAGLNRALNEASFLNMRFAKGSPVVDLAFSVLTLPVSGPEPDDPRRMIRLFEVGRIVVSYRHGNWDDAEASAEPISLDQLPGILVSFGGMPVYGRSFFDSPESSWDRWRDRLSLDATMSDSRDEHVIELFQESEAGPPRHLDLRIWFNSLAIHGWDDSLISIEEFGAGGARWWDALYAGDDRVKGHGIVPGRPQ